MWMNFLKEISETWSADSGEYRYHGKKVDAVLIDEAQFLSPEEVDTLSDIVDFYGIPVLCYGLRADFQTHLFPGSRRLMEIADIIEEVPTVCWCGRRAQCNTRYADGKNRSGRRADFPWIERELCGALQETL